MNIKLHLVDNFQHVQLMSGCIVDAWCNVEPVRLPTDWPPEDAGTSDPDPTAVREGEKMHSPFVNSILKIA